MGLSIEYWALTGQKMRKNMIERPKMFGPSLNHTQTRKLNTNLLFIKIIRLFYISTISLLRTKS